MTRPRAPGIFVTMRVLAHHSYPLAEYLAMERGSSIRHEFLDGEIFAMAGGTPEHAALAAAVIGQLHAQLRGKPCRVYTSDLRIGVQESGLLTYPDVSVICGAPQVDPADPATIVNPTLLLEVLSESTQAWDRGEKFEHYKRIPTLQDYVLVSAREQLIEAWRRSGPEWIRREARIHASLLLDSIGCALDVDAVYAQLAI